MTNCYFKVGGVKTRRSQLQELQAEEIEGPETKAKRILAQRPIAIDFARVFFFDKRDPASVLKAWEAARLLSAPELISVFEMPPCFGPWNVARVIGEAPEAAAN